MVQPPILYHPVIRQVLFPSIVEDPLETIVFSIGSTHELESLDIVGVFIGDWIINPYSHRWIPTVDGKIPINLIWGDEISNQNSNSKSTTYTTNIVNMYIYIYTHMSNPNKSVFLVKVISLTKQLKLSCLKIQEPKLKVPQRLWSSSKYLGDTMATMATASHGDSFCFVSLHPRDRWCGKKYGNYIEMYGLLNIRTGICGLPPGKFSLARPAI